MELNLRLSSDGTLFVNLSLALWKTGKVPGIIGWPGLKMAPTAG
jgi:hypothetical protein